MQGEITDLKLYFPLSSDLTFTNFDVFSFSVS